MLLAANRTVALTRVGRTVGVVSRGRLDGSSGYRPVIARSANGRVVSADGSGTGLRWSRAESGGR